MAKDSSFLPKDYLEKRIAQRTNIICASLFVVVMIAVVTAFFVTNRQRNEVKAQQEAINTRFEQAALQLEQSLTALATIYSQIQLIDAQDVSSGRAERLQADISDQVAQLNDLVSSINEVYDYGSKGMGSGE